MFPYTHVPSGFNRCVYFFSFHFSLLATFAISWLLFFFLCLFLFFNFFQFITLLFEPWQPLWADADQSIDFSSRHRGKSQNKFAKLPSLYPQRVHLLIRQPSSDGRDGAASLISDCGPAFSCNDNSEDSSSEIDPDLKVKKF